MGAVEQDWESVLDARGGGGDGGEDARYDAEYAESDAGSSKSVVFVGGQGSTTGLSEFASLTSLRMSGLGVGAGGAAHVPAYATGDEISGPGGDVLYKVESVLGSGAFSDVYLTTRGGNAFAMKCLKLDPSDYLKYYKAEFGLCREASLLIGLPVHKNIVSLRYVYADREASGSSVGRFLVFTDAVAGSRELSAALEDGSLLEGDGYHRVLQVGYQLANALGHVNGHGILHQDVKPENCLIFFDGGNLVTVKLLDFGLAAHGEGSGESLRARLSGFSPGYESPEIVRLLAVLKASGSEAAFREKLALSTLTVRQHDLWAYSITMLALFEALGGVEPPTKRANASGSRARGRLAALPDALVPAALGALFRRCLDADADLRPPSLAACSDCYALLLEGPILAASDAPGACDVNDLAAAAHNNLAVHMTALGTRGITREVMLHEADRLYAKAIAFDGTQSTFHANKAFLNCQLNQPEEAIASCHAALNLETTAAYMTNLGTALLLRTESANPPSRIYERVLQRRAEKAAADTANKAGFFGRFHLKETDDPADLPPGPIIIGGEALLDVAKEDDYASDHRDYLRKRRENQCRAVAAFKEAIALNPNHHAAFKGIAMAVPGAVHIGFRDFRPTDVIPYVMLGDVLLKYGQRRKGMDAKAGAAVTHSASVDYSIPFPRDDCLILALACYARGRFVIEEDPERSVMSKNGFLGVSSSRENGDNRTQTLTHIKRRISRVYRLRAALRLADYDVPGALGHYLAAARAYGAPATTRSTPARIRPLKTVD